jgi:hypothetical protein
MLPIIDLLFVSNSASIDRVAQNMLKVTSVEVSAA